MTIDGKNHGVSRKGIRPAFIRIFQWLSRQVFFQDGGLLANLRGVLAATLIAMVLRLGSVTLPLERNWQVALACLLVVIVSTAFFLGLRKRKRSADAAFMEASRSKRPPAQRNAPGAESRATVLEVHVYVEFGSDRDG